MKRALVVIGTVVAIVSLVSLWQADRQLSDNTLKTLAAYCSIIGDDDFMGICQRVQSTVVFWTTLLWLSVFGLVMGGAILAGGVATDRPKP